MPGELGRDDDPAHIGNGLDVADVPHGAQLRFELLRVGVFHFARRFGAGLEGNHHPGAIEVRQEVRSEPVERHEAEQEHSANEHRDGDRMFYRKLRQIH